MPNRRKRVELERKAAILELTESDIVNAIDAVEWVGVPITDGGQKVVRKCSIDGVHYALKMLLAQAPKEGEQTMEDDGGVANFRRAKREIQTMDQCSSPYIVKPGPIGLDLCKVGGMVIPFYTEEWIDGRTLADIISQSGRLEIGETVKLGCQMALAIGELWSLKKLHRDLKPLNIMHRTNGDFVLIDLGLVFDFDDQSLTKNMGPVGTAEYVAPERLVYRGSRNLDFRTDMFSLGIILYEASTGVHPFCTPGMSREEILDAILDDMPKPPSSIVTGVPTKLDNVILRLLSKRVHSRYNSIDMLKTDLKAAKS